MDAMYWLILIIALLVIEIITLGLTTIWFAGGALAAFILSMLGFTAMVQWIVFCVVSFVLLGCTRPWALRYFSKGSKVKTNVDSLIGQTAVVTADIDNLEGLGEVFVNGMTWTARAEADDARIAENTHVTIVAVSGVKLIVKVKEEG